MVMNWIRHSDEPSKRYTGIIEYWHRALKPFIAHIVHDLPYFNKSGGHDHIFVYTMDNGPLCERGYNSDTFLTDPLFRCFFACIACACVRTPLTSGPRPSLSAPPRPCGHGPAFMEHPT